MASASEPDEEYVVVVVDMLIWAHDNCPKTRGRVLVCGQMCVKHTFVDLSRGDVSFSDFLFFSVCVCVLGEGSQENWTQKSEAAFDERPFSSSMHRRTPEVGLLVFALESHDPN